MKIDVISDIHVDFWVSPKLNDAKAHQAIERFANRIFSGAEGETLFVAGDIGHYNRQNLLLLRWLSERYEHIFVTWGNHDLYLVGNNAHKKYGDSMRRFDELRRICDSLPNVTLLDGDMVEYKGRRIWGSGLWYPVEDIRHWRSVMSDALRIVMQEGCRRIDFDDYGKRRVYRFDPTALYMREIEKLQDVEGVDIVMTHVPPILSINENEEWDRYYRFDGEAHIARIRPKYWIFGHRHEKYDFAYGETRLLCNPLGYPDERQAFALQTVEV